MAHFYLESHELLISHGYVKLTPWSDEDSA